jgi:predicted MPP superfamily phosphohydrolase
VISKEGKRGGRRVSYYAVSLLLFIILVLGFYGIFIEPYKLEIRHVWIEDSQFAKVLEGKTIVHLSDLHITNIGKKEIRVLEILGKLEPDIIFLTGDYVSWKGNYEAAIEFLSKLKAKIAIWAVMGDYDYSYSRNSCLFCHERGSEKPSYRHQVTFLRNTFEKVDLESGSIWIGGIDPDGETPFDSKKIFLLWKRQKHAIILSHNPLNFEQLDENHNVLMLSGDTHGCL